MCEQEGSVAVPVYSRAHLLRILHITPRQLANWERKGLVTSAEAYTFSDLLELKKIRDLCAMSVRPNVIRESLDAMRKQASGVEKPLLEAGALAHQNIVWPSGTTANCWSQSPDNF